MKNIGQANMRAIYVLAFVGIGMTSVGCGGAKNKFEKEIDNEAIAVKLARETLSGKYDLVTTQEVKAIIDSGDDVLIVDTMPLTDSYVKAHLPGAKQFLFPKTIMEEEWDEEQTDGKSREDFESLLGEDKQRRIIIYCGYVKCARSHNGSFWAKKLGYQNVQRYPGGIFAWKGAKYPTESGAK